MWITISVVFLSAKYKSVDKFWLACHTFEKNGAKGIKKRFWGFSWCCSTDTKFFLNFINAKRKYQLLALKCFKISIRLDMFFHFRNLRITLSLLPCIYMYMSQKRKVYQSKLNCILKLNVIHTFSYDINKI